MNQTPERSVEESVDPSLASNEGDFLAIMLRRKWVVVFIMALGVGMGYLAYSKTPQLFQSTAQLLVINKQPLNPTGRMINASEVERLLAQDILSTQMMVIRSPLIVRRAVDKDKLNTLTSLGGNNMHAENAVSVILNGLMLTKGGDTLANESASVLNVNFRGGDKQDARHIVQSIVESYQDFLGENRRNVSDDMISLINNAKDSLHRDLLQKEAEYNAWRKSMPSNFISDGSGSMASKRVNEIEGERSTVNVRLAELRANIHTIEEGLTEGLTRNALMLYVQRTKGVGPNGTGGGESTQTLVEGQLFPLMIQEQLLTETLGENHIKVKVIRKQIEVLQELIMNSRRGDESMTPTEFLNTFLDSLRTEVRMLEGKETELTQQLEKDLEAAKLTLNYEDEGKAHRDGIERIKRMFDEVMDRLHEINIIQDMGGYEVRVLSEPREGYQVQPVLSRSLAIGGVLGALLGIAMAYLIDLADKSFRTPDEIRKELRLPVIGHIPVIEPPARSWRKKRKDSDVESKIDDMAVCFHRPRSTVAEAYRSIRTALYFGTGGEEHKVIQITSADAGDGKTTLAFNLAISIAQSGRRVCLVDADFRRSRLHEAFGLDASVGISSVIQGKAELPDAIQPTEVANLYVLPCGPRPANPSELLTSHRFKELLDMLRSKFDTIILDTPPILAVTDPSAVAPRVDSVLLVLRITKNVRPNAVRAKQVLDSLGAKVVGIVVNGVEMRAGYGHDSGYRRYAAGGYGHRDYGYGKYYTDEETEDTTPFNEVAVPTKGKI